MPQSPRILVVDNEPAVRRLIRTCLGRSGYEVLEAESGEEALAIYRERDLEIQLVVSDVRMAGMDGNDLARGIRELNPSQRILFVTAYAGDVNESGPFRAAVLSKPFSAAELLRRVAAQLTLAAAV